MKRFGVGHVELCQETVEIDRSSDPSGVVVDEVVVEAVGGTVVVVVGGVVVTAGDWAQAATRTKPAARFRFMPPRYSGAGLSATSLRLNANQGIPPLRHVRPLSVDRHHARAGLSGRRASVPRGVRDLQPHPRIRPMYSLGDGP